MQQALENIHYKKIWEEVNWKIRHPEAKSLKEALRREINSQCCLYEQFGNLNATSTKTDCEWHCSVKILGRPITLEDILILLSRKAYSISIPCIASDIIVTILSGGVVTEYFIDWQLGKPLHEQTPETWETIANLIQTLCNKK